MRLKGQVAVVTGAGRGIGREIALALARAGASVGLLARSAGEIAAVADEIAALGGQGHAAAVDLLDLGGVQRAVAAIEGGLGPADLLVNNAGSFTALGPIWAVDPDEWWRDIEVNVRGTFHATRAVVGGMTARGRGRIVVMVGGGTASSFPNGSGYAASKAGLMRFTECLADSLSGTGVLAFATDPGLVRTAMTEHQLNSEAGRAWMPRIATMFSEGVNVPPTLAAALAVDIAAGRFDRLNGRLLKAVDDLDALAARMDSIVADDLRMLRVTGMEMPKL